MKKGILINFITLGSFLLLSISVFAQPPGGSPPAGSPPAGAPVTGSPPAGGPPCWSPPCIPIDGGVGLLLAAGAFVGVRRIRKANQERATQK